MRGVAFLAAMLAACSPEPRRAFPIGLQGPVSPRVSAEATRLGLVVAEPTPEGAVVEAAAAVSGVAADWRTLRLLSARAAVNGSGGFFFQLPSMSAGRDILDFPEEWQAPARVLRELQAVRPVLEDGLDTPLPFIVPTGAAARAWVFRRRVYVLLVNPSVVDAPFDPDALRTWRALFEVQSDARQVLSPCGAKRCLAPGAALWLEGRLL